MRGGVFPGEGVNQVLGIIDIVVDYPGKLTLVLGIMVIEAGGDKFGMVVIAGKDDGLGQAVTPLDFMTVLHQMLQYLVHGIAIEEPMIDGTGVDMAGHGLIVATVAPVQAFPMGLFLVTQGVVVNPFPREAQVHLLHLGGDQKAIADGGFQFIGIGGDPGFQVE